MPGRAWRVPPTARSVALGVPQVPGQSVVRRTRACPVSSSCQALMPRPCERLEVVGDLLVVARQPRQPVVAGVEVHEEDRAGLVGVAAPRCGTPRSRRARRPPAPAGGSRRSGRSATMSPSVSLSSERRSAAHLARGPCPARPRSRPASPLTLAATGTSEPSEELKNASGSKSPPRPTANESPARVSASSGRSRPVSARTPSTGTRSALVRHRSTASWSTRSREPARRRSRRRWRRRCPSGRVASTSSPRSPA